LVRSVQSERRTPAPQDLTERSTEPTDVVPSLSTELMRRRRRTDEPRGRKYRSIATFPNRFRFRRWSRLFLLTGGCKNEAGHRAAAAGESKWWEEGCPGEQVTAKWILVLIFRLLISYSASSTSSACQPWRWKGNGRSFALFQTFWNASLTRTAPLTNFEFVLQ
jgi:hypothetical protein